MTSHEPFADAVAAYALDALDAPAAREFEAHLAGCAECQAEFAAMRRVTAGLGLAIPPQAPPSDLRARTLSAATSQPQDRPAGGERLPAKAVSISQPTARAATAVSGRTRPARGLWLALAASVAAVAAISMYAWALRSELTDLRQQFAQASSRVETLRAQLVDMRRDASRLINTLNIVSAPDLIRVDLRGQGGAAAASGRAFLSRGRGLVFRANQLPVLKPGRVYQVWVVSPIPGAAPVGAGVLSPDGGGNYILEASSLPDAVSTVKTVAVTDEPGPSGSPGPTTPPVLVGQL